MTKLETDYWYPEIIPGFDCLQWKQERQAEILRETEGMTRPEVREYFRQGSEEFQAELKRRRAELIECRVVDKPT